MEEEGRRERLCLLSCVDVLVELGVQVIVGYVQILLSKVDEGPQHCS